MTYKVSDKVQIIKNNGYPKFDKYIGMVGTIVKIFGSTGNMYDIKFPNYPYPTSWIEDEFEPYDEGIIDYDL